MKKCPKIAFTMGDPAGIGPEIIVRLLALSPHLAEEAELFVYGCPDILEDAQVRFCPDAKLCFEMVPTGSMKASELVFGKLSAQCGLEALLAVKAAAKDALSGKVDAIVTAPVNKAAVNLAGVPFTGHTELIAEICSTNRFAMMQSAGNLRIAFVTTHIALAEVPRLCTFDRIVETARLLEEAVRAEGIASPKLAVAAINPHAGENGHMGMEDERVVKPSVRKMLEMGMNVEGPFPPDTLFIESTRNRFDGILSMYHDQGHIPFKMLAFDRGVNSTLGLPIIRTSVDHGTAFDIAGRGCADCNSLSEAFRIAYQRAVSRRENA